MRKFGKSVIILKYTNFDLVVSCYNFTNLPFCGFTASSSSRCRALIHCAFTNLPFYGFTTSCPPCPRKTINLPIYGFTLVPSFSHLLYEFAVLRLHAFTTFICPCYTQNMNLQIYGFTSIPCACTRVSRFYACAMCLCWVFFSTFKHFPPLMMLMLRRKIFTKLLTRLMLHSKIFFSTLSVLP